MANPPPPSFRQHSALLVSTCILGPGGDRFPTGMDLWLTWKCMAKATFTIPDWTIWLSFQLPLAIILVTYTTTLISSVRSFPRCMRISWHCRHQHLVRATLMSAPPHAEPFSSLARLSVVPATFHQHSQNP